MQNKGTIRRFALWVAPFALAVIAFTTWHIAASIDAKTEEWVVGGWLINYSDGFIRRGLAGSALVATARLTGLGPATLTYGVVFCLVVGWALLFVVNMAAFRRPVLFGLVLFSPLVFLFAGIDDALLRKENLVFALLAWLSIARSARSWRWQVPVVLSPLMILCHEAIFAWMPAVLAIVLLRHRSVWLLGWLVLTSAGCLLAVIVWHGDMAHARHICALVNSFPQTHGLIYCRGAIAALGAHTERFMQHRHYIGEMAQAGLCAGLYIAPFVFLLAEQLVVTRHRLIVAGTFIAISLLTVPLFFVATDVGRWLRALFICTATVAAACKLFEHRNGYGAPQATADRRLLQAFIVYELIVITLTVGVANSGGPYFGFVGSLAQRASLYL